MSDIMNVDAVLSEQKRIAAEIAATMDEKRKLDRRFRGGVESAVQFMIRYLRENGPTTGGIITDAAVRHGVRKRSAWQLLSNACKQGQIARTGSHGRYVYSAPASV